VGNMVFESRFCAVAERTVDENTLYQYRFTFVSRSIGSFFEFKSDETVTFLFVGSLCTLH
jgi:hypothetical protein